MKLPSLFRRPDPPLPAEPAPTPDDAFPAASPFACGPAETERWNREWLAYLATEWPYQLESHHHYGGPLPATARELFTSSLARGPQAWGLALYCDPEAIHGRRLMELGCGCGSLAKQVGQFADSYLGVDFSTLALAVARLVTPANCTFVHLGDRARLEAHFGGIDTVVSRYFWIHQNLAQTRFNLEFLARFVVPGGRVYTDFFWPAEGESYFQIRPASAPLSRQYPSLMFQYRREDVDAAIAGLPFRLLREDFAPALARRFVVLERIAD
jgi:hypothetical protein